MPVNFQEVRNQIKIMGENALQREKQLDDRRCKACEIMDAYDHKITSLQQKVDEVLRFDRTLRCAKPDQEYLKYNNPLPDLDQPATLIAVDGSQINYDRHSEVRYAMINMGAIITHSSSSDTPKMSTKSILFHDDHLLTPEGVISESRLAYLRDLGERGYLVELAEACSPPVISLIDGPLEVWGAENVFEKNESQPQQAEYQNILKQLQSLKVYPAGFVDNPGANLVVRLLELTHASQADLTNIKSFHPLQGVSDIDLFEDILQPGNRSAIFHKQSLSTTALEENIQTKFFYLNVSSTDKPWLARVEIPAWVAQDPQALDCLHTTLIMQCNLLGSNAYPYILHRAHEIAVITYQEKEQIDQMFAIELRKQGISIKGPSRKQILKYLQKRARYNR